MQTWPWGANRKTTTFPFCTLNWGLSADWGENGFTFREAFSCTHQVSKYHKQTNTTVYLTLYSAFNIIHPPPPPSKKTKNKHTLWHPTSFAHECATRHTISFVDTTQGPNPVQLKDTDSSSLRVNEQEWKLNAGGGWITLLKSIWFEFAYGSSTCKNCLRNITLISIFVAVTS